MTKLDPQVPDFAYNPSSPITIVSSYSDVLTFDYPGSCTLDSCTIIKDGTGDGNKFENMI